MSRTAVLNVALNKNEKVAAVLLFLSNPDDPNEKLQKLKVGKTGQARFEMNAPGRKKLIWHIRGKPGGAIDLVVTEDDRRLGHVDAARSAILDDGEKENSGRLLLILED